MCGQKKVSRLFSQQNFALLPFYHSYFHLDNITSIFNYLVLLIDNYIIVCPNREYREVKTKYVDISMIHKEIVLDI